MRRKETVRVFNFSGGKSSALMTLLGQPTEDDIILFCDTGREHEKTYQFLDDFEKYEGLTIHRTTYTNKNAPGLTGYDAYMKNRRTLPNVIHRECTIVLKIKQARRYLRELGIRKYESYTGFRADEQGRILDFEERFEGVHTRFILNELGINKAMVNEFWANKPYTLDLPPILGNCDLCFLKGINAIVRILQKHPEYGPKWIKDERKGTFIKGVSYKELLKMAQTQTTLFDYEDIEPAFSCSCTA